MDLSDYEPTADLSRAETIPSRWYLEPDFLELEKERIFHRTWQWVGRSSQVKNPGDYVTCELMEEPLVVVRDTEGILRAFFNVCRHRAGPVASGHGSRRQLQCGYHGWTYGLDGRLRRAPEMEGVSDFRPDEVCLAPVSLVEWGPGVFVNLAPEAPALEEALGDIPAEVARAGFPVKDMALVERRDYVVECNWKVYVDNYLEGYHIPIVHPGLFREVDYEAYRVDAHRYYSSQHAPLRPLSKTTDGKRRYAPSREDERALYYWVFPNLMLNFYPENLQLNVVIPLDHERTLTVFEWYAEDEELSSSLKEAIDFSDEVQREDMAICRVVQRNLGSRSYDRGRFSVRRENGVHHFHLLLHEFLSR